MKIAVIGGGFFGLAIAGFCERKGFKVDLYERENQFMTKASAINQARAHGGYHYTRDFRTAYSSSKYLPRFVTDYHSAINSNFSHYYGIAKYDSNVTSESFFNYHKRLGNTIKQIRPDFEYNQRLIDGWFEVFEPVFDYSIVRELMTSELIGTRVFLGTEVKSIRNFKDTIEINALKGNKEQTAEYDVLFNCTYSDLAKLFQNDEIPILNELAEIALVNISKEFLFSGITIMDGPFFSLMPYPSRNAYSFTHVRYTPHIRGIEPFDLTNICVTSQFDKMIRDAQKFVPGLVNLEYLTSLYTNKTILMNKEVSDGRPIGIWHHGPNKVYSILGGKIDNIYDVYLWLNKIL